MNDYYIFLNSKSYPLRKENSFLDFTVDFPNAIHLTGGAWEIGLAEVNFITDKNKWSITICCDIISPSFVGYCTEPILRQISGKKGRTNNRFNPIYYFDVLSKRIDKIRLYINTDDFTLDSLPNDTLYCTLHLRLKQDEVHSEN